MGDDVVGFGHPGCYAAGLRACRGRVNREHYLSKSVLKRVCDGKTVVVRNLPFLKPEIAQEIGIASLTAKVLCEHHNSLLSPFDAAAETLFAGIEQFTDNTNVPNLAEQIVHVDADALERWMLKVFCGGIFSGNYVIPALGSRAGQPPPNEFLEILFNGGRFRDHKGLYVMVPDLVTTDRDILQVSPLHVAGAEVALGLRVWMFGFEFNLMAAGISFGSPRHFANAAYRPSGLTAEGNDIRIQFDWREGPRSPEVVFEFRGQAMP